MKLLVKNGTSNGLRFGSDSFQNFFPFFAEEIRHDWDVSYADLKSTYINRGHPVVIEDHQFQSTNNIDDYISTIRNLTGLIDSSPCNLQTNLVTGPHYSNLNVLLDLSQSSTDGWFVHFRNCDFSSVKASRALDEPPKFLLSHPKPFSSSWILLSDGYKVSKPKKLLAKHLVAVKQIVGSIDVIVAPRSGCSESCNEFRLPLNVGDILLFSADVWDFLYVPSGDGEAFTFIREYELRM